jgi:hypothetical protein
MGQRMPLHMTKIAYRSESADSLRDWLESQAGTGDPDGEARLTTRYLPKRAAEMAGGSLYWILCGVLVGRSPILGFAAKDDGKHWIRLAPRLIPVAPRPRRAHQGWRYLEASDAPPDLGDGIAGDALPGMLAEELGRLGLL